MKAGEAWLGRGLCIASSDGGSFADNGETDIQHETVIANLLESYGYTNISRRFGDGSVTSQHIIGDFNAGICTVNYTGHGSETAWGTSSFGTTHMKQLTNYNQLPFIFDVACQNGNFLYSQPCFAEGFLRAQKDGKPTGAIAIIASTIDQPWNPPMRGQDEMNEILCEKHPNNIKRTFGGITTNGILGMIEKYQSSAYATADTWTVFGDPSLLVRTLTAKTMNVTAPEQIALTDASVNVSCDHAGAVATISANGKIFGTAVIANGNAVINLSGLTNESTVTLTVVGYNKETVVKTINTNAAPNPHQPVSNLNASVSGNTVTLSWTNPSRATCTIYRNGEKIQEGVSGSTYTDTNVAGGTYSYCVEVVYGVGEVSDKVCVENVTVGTSDFAPVTDLKATDIGADVKLTWKAPNVSPAPEPGPADLTESFENGLPSTWKTIDADGDGYVWTTTPIDAGSFAGHTGEACISSASYINYVGALTPDNYLVTPELSLPDGGELTFWVCAQDANYAAEHFAVYASSTGNEAVNFTNALLEETLTAKKSVERIPETIRGMRAQGQWYQKTVQLPAGTKYAAIRHFDCTDKFWVNLDNVEIPPPHPIATYCKTVK